MDKYTRLNGPVKIIKPSKYAKPKKYKYKPNEQQAKEYIDRSMANGQLKWIYKQ